MTRTKREQADKEAARRYIARLPRPWLLRPADVRAPQPAPAGDPLKRVRRFR